MSSLFTSSLLLLLLVTLSISEASNVRYCCSGTKLSDNSQFNGNEVLATDCGIYKTDNTGCYTYTPTGSSDTTYGCGALTSNSQSLGTPLCGNDYHCCSTGDNCNCPPQPQVHKTVGQVVMQGEIMRKIMYPIMGVLIGLSWLALGFVVHLLPHKIVMIVLGVSITVLGTFLIFTPVTTYLGFFYMALGAFIEAVMFGDMDKIALSAVAFTSFVLFLLTGGLTVVSLDGYPTGTGLNYFDRLIASVSTCETSMNIENINRDYYNLDTRCENYLLLVAFCVFFLFLLQPFVFMIACVMARGSGGGGGGGTGENKPHNQL